MHTLAIAPSHSGLVACRIRIAGDFTGCAESACEIAPPPKASSLPALRFEFACLPSSAPTGFENPPPERKMFSVRARNAVGLYSVMP